MENDNITGPAIDIEEAEKLKSLFLDNKWKAMENYLKRMKGTAILHLLRRNQSAEDTGFYKGIIQVIDDIQLMPQHLGRQLNPKNKEG